MRRFTAMFEAIDRTTKTSVKLAALRAYFSEAPHEDAAHALALLTGQRRRRPVTTRQLREWISEETGFPSWLVDECYAAVGDLSETLALLLPDTESSLDLPLHRLIAERIEPLATGTDDEKRDIMCATWRDLDRQGRFVFHKLLSGNFRMGVSRRLVIRALAEVASLDAAVMEHRLMGRFEPTAAAFRSLIQQESDEDAGARPYPFFLASPLTAPVDELGDPASWIAEWKWDGLRAQLVRRNGEAMLWSRGEGIISASFPEVTGLASLLEDGVVIDGEVLAWENGMPLPFTLLQRRIGRKRVDSMLFPDVPIAFCVFDLLEQGGVDLRETPLFERRARLADIVNAAKDPAMLFSDRVQIDDWDHARAIHGTSRDRLTEGLILKRHDSPYRVGRTRGDWWKWKVDPFTIDAVLLYAYPGSGIRATLYTDYSFGVWDGDSLVPICRAYSGLTDDEIQRVDRHVRQTTIERKGPVRIVDPQLVFEIGFEGLQESTRHRSGIALRFPRMLRWRTDKTPRDADSIAALTDLLREQMRRATGG